MSKGQKIFVALGIVIAMILAIILINNNRPEVVNDNIEIEDQTPETPNANVQDIVVPDITIPDKEAEEQTVDVAKPEVPPTPEIPEREEVLPEGHEEVTEGDVIPPEEDVVKEGDTVIQTSEPEYTDPPTVPDPPIVENPVIVEDDTPTTDGGSTTVPDSENPFKQPIEDIPTNGDGGEIPASDFGEDGKYEMGNGDKF